MISHSRLEQSAPGAERRAQAKAFGLSKVWPTGQSVCVPKFSPINGPGIIHIDENTVDDGCQF